MELNPDHPLVQRLQAIHQEKPDDARLRDYIQVLRDQALLAEGGRLPDAGLFAKRVQELMLGAVGVAAQKREAKG
jgi:molecular chaperone HtpG